MSNFAARQTSAFVNTITLQKAYCIHLLFILLEGVALILHPVCSQEIYFLKEVGLTLI